MGDARGIEAEGRGDVFAGARARSLSLSAKVFLCLV